MNGQASPRQTKANSLFEGYRPLPGTPDELIGTDGVMRDAWRGFADHFSRLTTRELAHRVTRGNQYLQDAGVFFRQYGQGDSTERSWPLSHVPVLIGESEWQQIADGLTQRADVLEAVVADLYGPARLVADGHLPAQIVAGNPEWLRPMVGAKPRGGHHLHFVAFELGRGPDGRWWVLGDRTQAPSGAGFALENRMATSRVFADFYAEANVHRLASFFGAFRDALMALRIENDSRIAILSPGPLNDTYFEHAYIARYLGFTLVEGQDLSVQDGRVMVKTVAGPSPVSVIWRRMDAAYTDPLELHGRSRIGSPGLARAAREGAVTMVNALGAGVMESRAMLAFLPRLAVALTGRPLALPTIATWWCGQTSEGDFVRANLDRLVFGSALDTSLPFDLQGIDADAARTLLDGNGSSLVAHEKVTLSTTPALANGELVARPMTIRVFLARDGESWKVMPGGYARIGADDDPAAVAVQRGGGVADVWVMSDKPVTTPTMLSSHATPSPMPGTLPSRAADNLFWLGRYVERAENAMRLHRAYHVRVAEAGDGQTVLTARLARQLDRLGIDADTGVPAGLRSTVGAALTSASHIRDRFSVDGWSALTDLARTANRFAEGVAPGDDAARAMGVLLRKISGFSGLVHDNMYRFTGWRFLRIGRALERAICVANLLADALDDKAPEGMLDHAIEVADSVLTHRRRFSLVTSHNSVTELLALDELNPRAILYQLGEIREQLDLLPRREIGPMSEPSRLALELHTGLRICRPGDVSLASMRELDGALASLSEVVTRTYLS